MEASEEKAKKSTIYTRTGDTGKLRDLFLSSVSNKRL